MRPTAQVDLGLRASRRRVILALFGLAFLVMVFGVIPWEDIGISLPQLDWWFGELTALFLLFAIVIGLIGRLGEENLVSTFVVCSTCSPPPR